MSIYAQMPHELRRICSRWSEQIPKYHSQTDRIEYMQAELPALLSNKSLFSDIFHRIVAGKTYPDIRQTTMFVNEILLYMDPKRLFSLRVLPFDQREFTPIHDHNAWGVSGNITGILDIIKYRRDDDGSLDGYARICETEHLQLKPGDIDITLPLDAGLHKTGTLGTETAVMVSVYGNPIRRLYVNGFNLSKNQVYRIYAPRKRKRMLAENALKLL